jgi:hypothetical protein
MAYCIGAPFLHMVIDPSESPHEMGARRIRGSTAAGVPRGPIDPTKLKTEGLISRPNTGCSRNCGSDSTLGSPLREAQPHRHPSATRLSLSVLRFCHGNAGENEVASRSWAKCLLENHHSHGSNAGRERRIDPFRPFFDLQPRSPRLLPWLSIGILAHFHLVASSVKQSDNVAI